jgi:hypothetical protein
MMKLVIIMSRETTWNSHGMSCTELPNRGTEPVLATSFSRNCQTRASPDIKEMAAQRLKEKTATTCEHLHIYCTGIIILL